MPVVPAAAARSHGARRHRRSRRREISPATASAQPRVPLRRLPHALPRALLSLLTMQFLCLLRSCRYANRVEKS